LHVVAATEGVIEEAALDRLTMQAEGQLERLMAHHRVAAAVAFG
jgi:hypothetical protein